MSGVVAKPIIDPCLELVIAQRHEVRVRVDPERWSGEQLDVRVRLQGIVDVELREDCGVCPAGRDFVDGVGKLRKRRKAGVGKDELAAELMRTALQYGDLDTGLVELIGTGDARARLEENDD